MIWLFTASLIWAFSFGLIKGLITGVDPFMMGAIRMLFAMTSTLPLFFLKGERSSIRQKNLLVVAGFLQLGLMYAPYLASFRYLKAYEVALFTMTTPIIVVLVHQVANRTFSGRVLLAAVLSIIGGTVVAYKGMDSSGHDMALGIGLVQLANLLFALGQFIYARSAPPDLRAQARSMPYYFAGALLGSLAVSFIASFYGSEIRTLTPKDWLVLAWLGVVASGFGFAIWNIGVSKVSYGTLAVASDFKLPIAVAVSLIVFGETANLLQLATGVVLLTVASVMVRATN